MDAPLTNHPNETTLLDYAQGRLVGLSAEKVIEHLAICAECRGKIGESESEQRAENAVPSSSRPTTASTPSVETVRADARHRSLLRGTVGAERFEVGSGGVIGRDVDEAVFLLDHPHVSRRHASLTVEDGRVTVCDLESSNGTFVNGRRMTRPVVLAPGDRIDIGPYALQFDGSGLDSRTRSNNIELVARAVRRVVRNRATGEPLSLLEDVSIVVRPREFVCLLGPSGSGKSTLLAILSGRNPPTSGNVTVNGDDLYRDFEALKGDIAVVPQRDVMHDSLSVNAALHYTAELRLPPDLSGEDVDVKVSDILEVVGLTARQSTLIRHLSGGQVKRASLANELVAEPSLLFLDEVTSGLDEQTDREVMELFRQVADGGKTVVCITHSLANVEATCHLVVILTEGGRLAFVGTPDEAKAYFAIGRLGDVYRRLAERTPLDWHERFRASPEFRCYVLERLPSDQPAASNGSLSSGKAPRRGVNWLRQTWVLTRRYVRVWQGDWQALLVLFGQSMLVSLLLCLVFGDLGGISDPFDRVIRTRNLLLLLTVSCFWFGCNTAAKEVVKERLIYRRERDYNLRVGSYFASKLLVLALIVSAQATLLFGVVRPWCHPPGPWFSQWATLAALAIAGTSVGLFLSAFARTEEVATALVPLAVIPQIILAGVIAPLSGVAERLAQGVVSLYWGQLAIERLLPASDLVLLNRKEENWLVPLAVVALHALAATAAAIFVLRFMGAKADR